MTTAMPIPSPEVIEHFGVQAMLHWHVLNRQWDIRLGRIAADDQRDDFAPTAPMELE